MTYSERQVRTPILTVPYTGKLVTLTVIMLACIYALLVGPRAHTLRLRTSERRSRVEQGE